VYPPAPLVAIKEFFINTEEQIELAITIEIKKIDNTLSNERHVASTTAAIYDAEANNNGGDVDGSFSDTSSQRQPSVTTVAMFQKTVRLDFWPHITIYQPKCLLPLMPCRYSGLDFVKVFNIIIIPLFD
jgi:hypothetical protein